MGSVYNRGSPERPNIWVKFRDADGKIKRRPVGSVNPAGKTKAEVGREERELRRLAALTLAKIELEVAAGRLGFPDESAETVPAVGGKKFSEVGEPWAKKRKLSHRSGKDDLGRMRHHLIPFFGDMRLREIGTAQVKLFIELKRGKLKRQSILNCLSLLSRLFNDLIEDGHDLVNPVSRLDRATRRAIGPKHDPRRTPFLERKEDIRKVYLALPPWPSPLRAMFAVGVFGGLRTDEIIGLERADVKLKARRIHVQRSSKGPLKNHQSRVVPINNTLLPILREWMVGQGGGRVLFPPPVPSRGGRPGSPPSYIREHTLGKHLRKALAEARLPISLTWYQCTRHTFASHWVADGGAIGKLKEILGHASVTTTERYAHLAPDAFTEKDYQTVTVDLREGGTVVRLPVADERGGVGESSELGTNQDTVGMEVRSGTS